MRPAAFIVHRYQSHRERDLHEDKAHPPRNTTCSEIGEVHLGAGDTITREERNESLSGPRTSLSVRCYWPRIDGTLRLRFNIFNELAYQRENHVETVAPPRAEYLLLPLSAGSVDRITHRSLNLPPYSIRNLYLREYGAHFSRKDVQ